MYNIYKCRLEVWDVQENKFTVHALNHPLAEDKLKNVDLNMDVKKHAKEEENHIAVKEVTVMLKKLFYFINF